MQASALFHTFVRNALSLQLSTILVRFMCVTCSSEVTLPKPHTMRYNTRAAHQSSLESQERQVCISPYSEQTAPCFALIHPTRVPSMSAFSIYRKGTHSNSVTLSLRYGHRQEVLQGLSLQLAAGESGAWSCQSRQAGKKTSKGHLNTTVGEHFRLDWTLLK